jgi:hypothetical protein
MSDRKIWWILYITTAIFAAFILSSIAAHAQQRQLFDHNGRHVGNATTDSAGTTTIYGADGRVTTRESIDSQGTRHIYGPDGRSLGTITKPGSKSR